MDLYKKLQLSLRQRQNQTFKSFVNCAIFEAISRLPDFAAKNSFYEP